MQTTQPVLFSGIQPSGMLTIAHYTGAIRHWVDLQSQYDCFFSVVDLHAMTVVQDPQALHKQSLDLYAWYLALGIDPQKSTLFIQSQVPHHAQLSWILNCFTYTGELNRMTQYKDKVDKHDNTLALYAYPVLQAADILLYDTCVVPVGEDQKQHLELTRTLARRINQQYGELFTVPEVAIVPLGGRLLALQDPSKKMSKSDDNQQSTIFLQDSAEVIVRKIKRSVTDMAGCVKPDPEQQPGITNLLNLYACMTGESVEVIAQRYEGKGYGIFKQELADVVVGVLSPYQQEYAKLRQQDAYLQTLIDKGAERAAERAQPTLQRIQEAMGFLQS